MWKHVIAPMVVVVLFWVISSVATSYYIHWQQDMQSRMISEDLSTIRATGAMRASLRHLQRAITGTGLSDRIRTAAEVARLEDDFQRGLAEADATSLTQDERTLVDVIRHKFADYSTFLAENLKSDTTAAALETPASREHILQMIDAVAEPCKRLGEINEEYLRAATSRMNEVAASVNWVRFALLLVGPALGILAGFWMAGRFRRSISRISITLNDVASDMDQPLGRIDVKQGEDLSQLQGRVQVVADRIRHVMEELQSTRLKARAAARLAAVGELAAGVAHELRNPLTSVKLLIQMAAQRQPAKPLTDKQLQVVQEEIARMESTLERLLDFARPPQIRRLRHDVRDTVRRALNLVEGRADHQKVRIVQQIPDEPVMVNADPEQLHQVFVNLLLNGLESMADGGMLRVQVDADASLAGVCRIAFLDTGSGIPPALTDRIFEPFVTNKERGVGLGLPISQRIIHEHGGKLIAANRAAGGAAFTVELPLAEQSTDSGAAVSQPADAGASRDGSTEHAHA